jgi:hypothetical protein
MILPRPIPFAAQDQLRRIEIASYRHLAALTRFEVWIASGSVLTAQSKHPDLSRKSCLAVFRQASAISRM